MIGLACSGKKFAIFALFYFVLKGKYQVQVPGGGGGGGVFFLGGGFGGGFLGGGGGLYIRWGDLTDGFLRYDFGGLIIGGAYFRNFTVCKLIFK